MTAFQGILKISAWLPASVGNHTNYSGGTRYSGGYSGSGHSGSGLSGLFFLGGSGRSSSGFVTVVVVLILIALIAYNFRRSHRIINAGSQPYETIPRQRDDEISGAIRAHDPDFSRERFLSWAEQVFVQLQQAWTERDWKKARPFESEELFNLHKSQLDSYIKSGTINIMDNVCVNESFLCDYAKEDKFEFLTVFMNTRYNDYVVKEDTKAVVKGDPNRTYSVQYKLKFMRSLGVVTTGMSNASTVKCPNCGAPVDVNAAGQCAYCGTVITNGEHDWVLCNLDDINQF